MKKLTKKDYKEIADNLDLSRLWEDIEDAIDRYCDDNKIKSPKEPMVAMEEVYQILTNQKEKSKSKNIKKLKKYIKYVEEYADDHEIKGNYPVCYNEWLNNEYEENK